MSYKKTIPHAYLREHAFNMRWAEVGPDVIPLTAADTDLPISKDITDAIISESLHQLFPYGPAQGLLSFREALAHHYNENKASKIQANQIIATNSAATALQDWCNHFLKPGDDVLIPDPVDFLLGYCAEQAGATVSRVEAAKNWNEEEWARNIKPNTKAIFICHPHNPLGFSYDRKSLQKISNFAIKHKLLLLSDEVWSDVVLSEEFVSMAAVDPKSWVIYGLSKGFGLAGLRIGAIIGPDADSIQPILDQQGYTRTTQGVSTLSQIAAAAAMKSAYARIDFIQQMRINVDYVFQRLSNEQSFFEVTKPSSTFVFWMKHPEHWDTLTLTQKIESEALVKLVPGLPIWFGPGAKGHVRMSCATSIPVLEEALNRLIAWTKNY